MVNGTVGICAISLRLYHSRVAVLTSLKSTRSEWYGLQQQRVR